MSRLLRQLCLLSLVAAGGMFAEELTVGEERFQVNLLHEEDFSGPADRWRYDGRGRVWIENERMQMDATGVESTAWFTEELTTPLVVTYEAQILDPVESKNINLIFLASGPDGGDVLRLPFTGSYPEYHEIPNYIWTVTAGHTRLRRNPGFQMVSEDTENLPEAHRTYKLTLVAEDGTIRCFIDGKPIHSYRDAQPHTNGKLGFRTFHTRLWWDNLKIYRLVESPQ